MEVLISVVIMTIGLVMLVKGADIFVDAGSNIGRIFKISEILIGLTFVCVGTGLPELLLSITGSLNGSSDFVIGNIVGTNIFNIGIVLGVPLAVCGSISPITFSNVDMIMVLVSALLLFFFAGSEREISKKEGVAMLFVFLVYYAYLFINI